MNRRVVAWAIVLTCVTLSGAVWADDLTGSDKFLCTAVLATACTPDGECSSGPPWNLNIPQFIEVDLKNELLSTTKASGESRTTKIKHLERENDLIVIQGFEGGRAFSFLIEETTGMVSIAVAREETAVVVFGACTPR